MLSFPRAAFAAVALSLFLAAAGPASAQVFNPEIVPYAFLSPDLAKIQAHADATQQGRDPEPIAGVRFTLRPAVTVRR